MYIEVSTYPEYTFEWFLGVDYTAQYLIGYLLIG